MAVTAGAARADDELPPVGGTRGPIRVLLDKPSVQKELNLNREQVAKAHKVLDAVQARYQADINATSKLKGPEVVKALKEIDRKAAPDIRKGLAEAIGVPATRRLLQIEAQDYGVHAFLREEYRDHLALTKEQLDKIAVLDREVGQKAFGTTGNDAVKMQVLRQLNTEGVARIRKDILTDKQKAQWDKLAGPHYEFPYPF